MPRKQSISRLNIYGAKNTFLRNYRMVVIDHCLKRPVQPQVVNNYIMVVQMAVRFYENLHINLPSKYVESETRKPPTSCSFIRYGHLKYYKDKLRLNYTHWSHALKRYDMTELVKD